MQTHYSPEYPLGFNANYHKPEIPFYLSWDEVAEITRTGVYTDADGKKYTMADAKEHRPIISYTGNFSNRRSNDTFTGTRSPYIAVDIDIDQNASGLSKYSLTDEQRAKVESDIEVMLDYLSGGKRDFFFCKRSTSGCGLHLVIKLEGAPDDKIAIYEREIIHQFNKALKEITGLYYKYAADPAMMKLSQPLGLSIDEKVIYNPSRVTPASMYNPTPEYGEQTDGVQVFDHLRIPHRLDRINFKRFSKFCQKKDKRLPYGDIFRLLLIFMQLWPDASLAEFVEVCSGLNYARAKERGENNEKFLLNEYKKVKKAISKTYKGNTIGINSLYFIREKYDYVYEPDKELRFTGYLSSIEKEILEVFDTRTYILMESPTGSGKTYILFKYLKEQARKNPDKNYVLALPYKSMVGQFAKQNSDGEFTIGVLTGDEEADKNFSKLKKKRKKRPKKKKPVKAKLNAQVDGLQGNLFEEVKRPQKERLRNLWCSTYDSAIKLWNIDTLVIDESHNMVAQVEFRPEAMEALANIRCKKRILITGTPEILLPETLEDAYYLRCVKEDTVKPKLRIERVKGSLAEAAKNSIVGKSSSITFWNNKPQGEKLREMLLREAVSASLYNRDTSEEAHQKKLKEESLISTHAIATCFISEGINVLNAAVEVINIVDDYSITNIRQAAARPRKCVPEIKLILKETDYKPGIWVFHPVKEFIAELARLEVIAAKLTELSDGLKYGGHENLYTAFEDDEPFMDWDKNAERWQNKENRYYIKENMVKASIVERYRHWLYHKKRELWLAELGKYFEIVEEKVTDNTGKNERKKEEWFDIFRETSHELIMEFRAYKIKTADGRRRKKEPYTPEMAEWARAHDHLELKKEWERWTERYVKMWEYGAVNHDTIKSAIKFSYWEKSADMFVSVREGADTPKEARITETNREVMAFLLGFDYSTVNVSKPNLYLLAKNHIRQKKLKPVILKERQFWHSLKDLLKVELRQKKSTGKRYVKSVSPITGDVAYSTGKLERQAKETANVAERESIDKFLGVSVPA